MKIDCRHKYLLGLDHLGKSFSQEELLRFQERTEKNYAVLENGIDLEANLASDDKLFFYPNDPVELVALLKKIHKEIFKDSGLILFGEFRADNETVVGDDLKKVGFDPIDYTEIEKELAALYSYWFHGELNDKKNLAKRIANILINLFNIHPFRDGNGRTGRLFSKIFAKKFGFNFHFSGEEVKKEYISSIEHYRKRDNSVTAKEENSSSYRNRINRFANLIEKCLKEIPHFNNSNYT